MSLEIIIFKDALILVHKFLMEIVMEMFYYKLSGKNYPARTIDVDGDCLVISTEELNKDLFDEKGQYISNEARNIDEEVFFFVPTEIIKSSEERIAAFLQSNL